MRKNMILNAEKRVETKCDKDKANWVFRVEKKRGERNFGILKRYFKFILSNEFNK